MSENMKIAAFLFGAQIFPADIPRQLLAHV
jgi:hypothetical protein